VFNNLIVLENKCLTTAGIVHPYPYAKCCLHQKACHTSRSDTLLAATVALPRVHYSTSALSDYLFIQLLLCTMWYYSRQGYIAHIMLCNITLQPVMTGVRVATMRLVANVPALAM
jgi:hypothetical protein